MKQQIASIYFDEVSLERSLYGGYYKISAVPKDADPVVIDIQDAVQSWQQVNLYKKQIKRDHIDAMDIARDCIQHWTQNHPGMSPTCHPGIWRVRNEVAVLNKEGIPEVDAMNKQIFRPATDAERRAMWDEDLAANKIADANWAEYRMGEADIWWEEPRSRMFISENHRRAARQYGREKEWLKTLKDNDIRFCPVCRASNHSAAMKCGKCGEIIDAAAYKAYKDRQKQILRPEEEILYKFNCPCGEKFKTPQEFARHRVSCQAKEAAA